MNDPRENKKRVVSVGWSGNHTLPEKDILHAMDLIKSSHLDYAKLFCTTIDRDKNPFGLNTKRCFGRPRVWAQYGDRHRGVCLVFDRSSLENEISASLTEGAELWSGTVNYDDYLKSASPQASDFDYDFVDARGIEIAVREHVAKFKDALFFRKDSDWSGESEWRCVIYRCAEGYEHIPFCNSLKAIVMGVDCSKSYAPTLRSLADGIPLLHLEWDDQKEDFYYREI